MNIGTLNAWAILGANEPRQAIARASFVDMRARERQLSHGGARGYGRDTRRVALARSM
jgi:hypothetical protein